MSAATGAGERPWSARLHPQAEAMRRRIAAQTPVSRLTLEQARAADAERFRMHAGALRPVHEVRRVAIPAAHGAIGATVYRPQEARAPGVLVWLHGGAWIMGAAAHSDDQVRVLADASGCVVVSVDYRLAPEHRFPAGLEDCVEALRWAADHAAELGAASGPPAVGGESAGGNLAAAAALLARDRGGPPLAFQLLVYPVLCRDLDVPSRAFFPDEFPMSAAQVRGAWDLYLADEADAASPYAAPLLAASLAGLPPACVVLAQYDVLHDEGLAYAERLRAEGVPVELHEHAGMLHGFVATAGAIDLAFPALERAGRAVGAALRSRAAP